MFLLDRIESEYHLRGLKGVARLLGTRVIRWRADLLFEKDLARTLPDASPADALPALVISVKNLGTDIVTPVERQIFVGDNVPYRKGLHNGDLLFAGVDENGRVITYAFVLFRTHYKRLLRIPHDVPLIANCFTEPAMRGRRLYPRMLLRVCHELSIRGYSRATISCDPRNVPSIRGIEHAGFRGLSHIRSLTVLWRLVLVRCTETFDSWRSREGHRA